MLVLLLLASACSGDSGSADSQPATATSTGEPTTEIAARTAVPDASPSADTSPAETQVDPERAIGAASWALVDGVPAYRKNGVLIKSGLVYRPLLDIDGRQTAAELGIEAEQSILAIVLNRFGQTPFDQVQVTRPVDLDGSFRLSPFVVTGDNQVFIFSDGPDSSLCDEWAEVNPLEGYGVIDHFDGAFDELAPTCLALTDGGTSLQRVGNLPETHEAATVFGILVDAEPGAELQPIALDWLALAHSSLPADQDEVLIRTTGLESSIAFRTEDPSDDRDLQVLSVEEFGTGVTHQIAESAPGEFALDTTLLATDIVQISMDDYGQQIYPYQGAWVDLGRLGGTLTIDFSPEFTFELVPTPKSERTREPHRLSIWNGSTTAMEFHEYRGLTFSNNEGNADRDRTRDNPNGCRRIAILGGSWIEAIQTRIDQKPALIAEAILDARLPGCHEVITFGRDTFGPENHYPFAKELVEEFGVELLIFGISRHNLCRMDDDAYTQRWEVALETPLRWRLVNGEMVEPFSRREATPVEADPDYVNTCTFRQNPPEGTTAEIAVVQKAHDLTEVFGMFGDGVEVRYLNIRDVYRESPETALQIQTMCTEIGLACPPVPVPATYLKPEDIADHSPFLFRYRDDGHPNIRANQHLGRDLAAFIEEVLEQE